MTLHPVIVALVLLTALPVGAQQRHQMLVEEKSGSVLELTAAYSLVPPTGWTPVRVKAINNTNGDVAVSVSNSSRAHNNYGNDHQLDSSFSFTAAAGKTTERELMVPLCTSGAVTAYYSPDLYLEVKAGGRTERFSFDTGGFARMPFAAFSAALAAKSIADINSTAAGTTSGGRSYSYGRENFAALYDPAGLSSDWRGFSGLDVLAITSAEWTALQPAVKSAALQWVKLGGSLLVYAEAGHPGLPDLGIPVQTSAGAAFGGDSFHLGMGRVCDLPWSGKQLEGGVAEQFRTSRGERSHPAVRRLEYSNALRVAESGSMPPPDENFTPLVNALGRKDFAAWQVGIILLIFGIVVGPVNLFYLAGKGRRHRLFLTTPIISLAAAALLLMVIFFQDGTGGEGHRASLVYLDSHENAAFIHQMQVARTGVLFGGSFEVEDSAVVNMAVMPDSRWTRLKGQDLDERRYGYRTGGSRGESHRYSVQENSYGGDYFQSRSEQAQFIDAVQSTRGRLELKPGSNPPVVTSTIAATLDRVCYVDAQGNYWASSGPVTTGVEAALTQVTGNDFAVWRRGASGMLHEDQWKSLEASDRKNFFYASSKDPAAGILETLDSIEWKGNSVFLYGPLK